MSSVDVADRRGSVFITLQRPDRRNAYDREMAEEVIVALQGAAEAEAVVISGSGGSFCAGGALDQLAEPTEAELRALFTTSVRLLDAVRACPRPVIAAVDGAAAGGGNELVVACDLAIATERSSFGQTGPRVGSAPVLGGTNVMAVQIGEKRAKELSFLCRRYTAAQALAMGLINEVVADDGLEAAIEGLLDEIHELSPLYLEVAKVSSNQWWNQSRDNMSAGIGMLVRAIGSPDMIEGATAFREKRRPDFRGGR